MDTKTIVEQQEDIGIKLIKRGYGSIRDLKNGNALVIWNALPNKTRREGWFILKNGRTEMILNKHQLQYLMRNV